jgi:hypothetical protein
MTRIFIMVGSAITMYYRMVGQTFLSATLDENKKVLITPINDDR